jgi:hypothetical protein
VSDTGDVFAMTPAEARRVIHDDLLAGPVEDLWPGQRSGPQTSALHYLRRDGIDTVAQLLERRGLDLLAIRGFGLGYLDMTRRALGEHGLGLRGEEVSTR